MKLTQKSIAGLEMPPGKIDHFEFDSEIPGFAVRLRVGKKGTTKTLVFQYGLAGRDQRMTLGKFPAAWSDRTRKIASELYAKKCLGLDPAGEKAEERTKAAETVGAVLRTYLPRQKGRLRPRSYAEVERHLLVHAKPLHGLQLTESTVAPLLRASARSRPGAAPSPPIACAPRCRRSSLGASAKACSTPIPS